MEISTFFFFVVAASSLRDTQGEISGRFDERIPLTARGIKDENLAVPCGVSRLERGEKVIWRKVATDQIIESGDRVTVTVDDGVWNLRFDPLLESDAGTYECSIVEGLDEKSIYYTLSVLESRDGISWRSSLKCGPMYVQFREILVTCDAEGSYPCCGFYANCGYSPMHCDCHMCTDYRKNNTKTDAEPYFLNQDLSTVRSQVGARSVKLPCTVKNFDAYMQFNRTIGPNEYELLLDAEDLVTNKNPKYNMVFFTRIATIYMEIKDVQKSDEGTYHCFFIQNDKFYSKEINLVVLDEDEPILWHTRGFCGGGGGGMHLHNGSGISRYIQQPCDSLGATPCCSGDSWCGFGVKYCECKDCIDYRLYDPLWQNCASNNSFQCDMNICLNSFKQCDGVYDCEDGMDEYKCDVTGNFYRTTDKINGTVGEPFYLPCQIENLGEHETVNWRRVCDDKPLPHVNVTDISVESDSSLWKLTFANVSTSHVGNYSCEIRTEFGVLRKIYSCESENTSFTCQELGEDVRIEAELEKCGGSGFYSNGFLIFGFIALLFSFTKEI